MSAKLNHWTSQNSTFYLTQNRSFRTRSSKPVSVVFAASWCCWGLQSANFDGLSTQQRFHLDLWSVQHTNRKSHLVDWQHRHAALMTRSVQMAYWQALTSRLMWLIPAVRSVVLKLIWPRPSGHFGITRYVRLSVPWRSCLGYTHTGCLQLSHCRPPEMCGLQTCPWMDTDPPRFLPSNWYRQGGRAYRLVAPGVIPRFLRS